MGYIIPTSTRNGPGGCGSHLDYPGASPVGEMRIVSLLAVGVVLGPSHARGVCRQSTAEFEHDSGTTKAVRGAQKRCITGDRAGTQHPKGCARGFYYG